MADVPWFLGQLENTARTQFVRPLTQGERTTSTEYQKVCILGGGTAGYLTALTLRRLRPELEVTLIESSKLPPIGVGEATTSEIIPYLHLLLGFDIAEFYQQVQPTWKLGIRFEWGSPDYPYFNGPFDFGRPLESLTYDGHLNHVSLMSLFMTYAKSPLLASMGAYHSLLNSFPYAYHLDNHKFLAYLRSKLVGAGVDRIDTTVDTAVTTGREEIECLVDSAGHRWKFDLYVDCSGFRSFLMGHSLKSPFVNYSSSLYTDRALIANSPHQGGIKPYTTARTMNHGWAWNIPTVADDHVGYVFSSSFADSEGVETELRSVYPALGDTREIQFRSGRHAHCWKGNVVAMGNAYGFVEPLESTGIQALLAMNLFLAHHFPTFKRETRVKEILNRKVAEYWDQIRWFLSIHFKFNEKLDSQFWRSCRAEADITGATPFVELFQQGAPLIYRTTQIATTPTLPYLPFAYDILLMGQGVEARQFPVRESESVYRNRLQAYKGLLSNALDQRAALAVLQQRPDLLSEQFATAGGWTQGFDAFVSRFG